MPTKKRRMQITLEPETLACIEETAALLNIPTARLAAQMLNESMPVFEQMANSLRLASQGNKAAAINVMNSVFDDTGDQLKSIKDDITNLSSDSDIKPASTAANKSSKSVSSCDAPDIGEEA